MAAIDACIGDGVTPNSGCEYGEIPTWDTSLVTDMEKAFGCRGAGGCAVGLLRASLLDSRGVGTRGVVVTRKPRRTS